MSKTKHGIWAKMLAKYAVDADPEEVAEAVEAIDEIVSEKPEEEEVKATDAEVSEKLDMIKDMIENLPKQNVEEDEDEVVPEEEKTEDAEPDKQDIIIDLLKQLVAKQGADCGPKGCATKDEAPAEEDDPLKKLEEDLDEIEEKTEEVEASDEDEEIVPEEGFAPEEDSAEPESHFVDPEEINEQDEDETEEEEKPIGMDKRARDSMREILRTIKPMIAALPPRQRKIATDAAVKSIRRSYGMDEKPSRNNYTAIKQNRKKAVDKAVANRKAEIDLAKKIMSSRNVNFKK